MGRMREYQAAKYDEELHLEALRLLRAWRLRFTDLIVISRSFSALRSSNQA